APPTVPPPRLNSPQTSQRNAALAIATLGRPHGPRTIPYASTDRPTALRYQWSNTVVARLLRRIPVRSVRASPCADHRVRSFRHRFQRPHARGGACIGARRPKRKRSRRPRLADQRLPRRERSSAGLSERSAFGGGRVDGGRYGRE